MSINTTHFFIPTGAIAAGAAAAAVLSGQYLLVAAVALTVLGVLAVVWQLLKPISPSHTSSITYFKSKIYENFNRTTGNAPNPTSTPQTQRTKTPLFLSRRPPALKLNASPPRSTLAKELFLTPLSSTPSPLDQDEDVFVTPRCPHSAEGHLLPPAQQLVDLNSNVSPPRPPEQNRLVAPPVLNSISLDQITSLLNNPTQGATEENLDCFMDCIAAMSDEQLKDTSIQKQIEKAVKNIVLDNQWDCLKAIKDLYSRTDYCDFRNNVDQVLDRPIIYSLIQEPIEHVLHYFRLSQEEIFDRLGGKKYEFLIQKFIEVLNQKPVIPFPKSVERNPHKTVKQRLAELVAFIATTWTAQFAWESKRVELKKLLDSLEDADPMDCLRELRILYQEKEGISRKHLDLLLNPSRFWNPTAFLKKKTVFYFVGFVSDKVCGLLNLSSQKFFSMLGKKQYKQLIQHILQQKPVSSFQSIQQAADRVAIDISF